MSDTITGISVLDRTMFPERLFVLCSRADGKAQYKENIPVYQKGSPKPFEPGWNYEISGDSLLVKPSLKLSIQRQSGESREIFHNEGSWTVKFQEFKPDQGFESAFYQFMAANNLESMSDLENVDPK